MTDERVDRGLSVDEGLRLARRRGGQLASQKQTTTRNWQRIFATIVIYDGPSAKDIAEITGLPQSTITGVLDQMRAKRLIHIDESVERRGRGRRPRPVRIDRRGHYIAGVEIQRDLLTGVIVDLGGEPVGPPRERALPTTRSGAPVDPDALVDGVRDLVDDLIRQLRAERSDAAGPLMGLGVELGGHIDGRSGAVIYSPNLCLGPPWTDAPVPLRQRLRDATRLYTVVDNDANALGVAQQWFGAARSLESFQVVLVSLDGIGAAYFADGELVRGATGKANELGHVVIEPRGERCRCGNRGCVEAHASGPAILRYAYTGEEAARESLDAALARAREEASADPRMRRAFADAGDALGRGLASLLNVNDPGKVILIGDAVRQSSDGSRLVLFNDDYHDAMWTAVTEHTYAMPPRPEDFVTVDETGRGSGPRGAATMVIRDLIAGAVPIPSQAESARDDEPTS